MREHELVQICSLEQAAKIAYNDARYAMVTHDEKSYVKENTLSYYALINTWMLLWKNFAQHAYLRFFTHLCDVGLISCIKECQVEADRLIHQEERGPWARILAGEFRVCTPVIDRQLSEDLIGTDELATTLFLLRYPKRFSPSCNDMIKEETIREFIATEKKNKEFQRKGIGAAYLHYIPYLREVVEEMYPWDAICDKIQAILDGSDDSWLPLPPGSSLFTPPAIGAKIMAILKDPRFCGFHHTIMGDYRLFDIPRTQQFDSGYSRVVAVPKSYKSSRIIAMEDIYRNIRGLQIEELFREHDARSQYKFINIEDQSINQELARLGSITDEIATLDASHASDYCHRSLFIDIFPRRYTSLIMQIIPEYVLVNERKRPLQMISTSGHTLTFRHETIIYKAIAEVSERLCDQLIHPITHYSWAFGDDTVVNSQAYDIAVHLFQVLGLHINGDKSYEAGPYRESCGKDYWLGRDISGIYYPRFPVIGQVQGNRLSLSQDVYRDTFRGKLNNSLSMLIDLQHKLFPYSYECARLLASLVQWAYPSITTSVAGTVCSDLWDFAETGKTRRPKTWRIVQNDPLSRSAGSRFEIISQSGPSLHGDNLSVFERLAALDMVHTYPAVGYKPRNGAYTDYMVRCYDYWRYRHFLKFGPQYEDSLSELLGVSSAPMSIAEFFGDSTLRIVTK